MALLRIGGLNSGKRREELLSSYEGEEPYMPGGYETPYDGDDPYMPEGYEAPYDDDLYEDDYDDDYGYEDDYEGGSRYDDDYGYDEAYGYDEDGYPYDEEYDREPYYGDTEYVGEPEYPDGALGSALRYMDENDWVTWLLLFLLPPLGIWLLWRRRRYSQSTNAALTVISLLWVAILLVLLVVRPFRPRSDTTITPQPVGAAAATEAPAEEEEAPVEEEPAAEVASLLTNEEVDEANAVYVIEGIPYYHQQESCSSIPANSTVIKTSRNAAIDNNLMACPYCLASQYSDGTWDLVFVNASTEDRSGLQVYCSSYNSYFHTKEDCSDIGGTAHQVGLKDALLMGRAACPTCCANAAKEVFCTVDGTYYHVDDECSGMRNASHVTYAEARVLGKKRCPTCIGGEDETEQAAVSGYYVYATPKGTYYHVNPTCSGMKDAEQVLLSDMLRSNRPPCPVCCANAEMTVFSETGNPYYHSYATCSGMTNATPGILVNALVAGLSQCPTCWTQGSAEN
ncbi:MAG: hypothetical protein Q4C10_02200 [Clostridia bacterium]|nr:hypothetical protein [Clostridia bacterium]